MEESLKFCHYLDDVLDNQLKAEINYDTFLKDITLANNLLKHFTDNFNVFIVFDLVKQKYLKFDIKEQNHKIIIVCLNRLLTIMLHKVNVHYGENKEECERAIDETRFLNRKDYINKMFNENNIKENEESNNLIEELLGKEEKLRDHSVKPSLTAICNLLINVNLYLEKGLDDMKQISNNLEKCKEDKYIDFFHNVLKLQLLTINLQGSFVIAHDNLFNLAESSDEWTNLKKNIQRITKITKEEMKVAQQKLIDFVFLANAALSQAYKFEGDFLKVIGSGIYFAFYILASDMKEKQNKIFSLNPDKEVVKKIWNLLDTDVIGDLALIPLEGIKMRKVFYIKKEERELDLETMKIFNKMIKTGKTNYHSSSKNKRKYSFTKEEIDLLDVKLEGIKTDENNKLNKSDKSEKFEKMGKIDTEREILNKSNQDDKSKTTKNGIPIKEMKEIKDTSSDQLITDEIPNNPENYVKIRLLFHKGMMLPKFKSGLFTCCTPDINRTRNSLIIHIHGGGFVAMSSQSHECYLRKWANGVGCPIVSIDYRLSPEAAYPKALDDVWQAYNWIINNAPEYFQINLDKIILVGDSAGGNLVLGLTFLLIFLNKRAPDVLFLNYPAMRCDITTYSISGLLSLTDKILSYPFIKVCMDAYVQEYGECDQDMFLNPIFMENKILKLLPPIKMFVGTNDPLRDDIIQFLHILTTLKKDAKLFEFKYFPHGFLNYDIPMMMPEASICNDIVIEEMDKFLNSTNNTKGI